MVIRVEYFSTYNYHVIEHEFSCGGVFGCVEVGEYRQYPFKRRAVCFGDASMRRLYLWAQGCARSSRDVTLSRLDLIKDDADDEHHVGDVDFPVLVDVGIF